MALTEWVRFAEAGNHYPLLTLSGVGVTWGQPGDVYPYYTTTGIPVTFAAAGDPYPFVTVSQTFGASGPFVFSIQRTAAVRLGSIVRRQLLVVGRN